MGGASFGDLEQIYMIAPNTDKSFDFESGWPADDPHRMYIACMITTANLNPIASFRYGLSMNRKVDKSMTYIDCDNGETRDGKNVFRLGFPNVLSEYLNKKKYEKQYFAIKYDYGTVFVDVIIDDDIVNSIKGPKNEK